MKVILVILIVLLSPVIAFCFLWIKEELETRYIVFKLGLDMFRRSRLLKDKEISAKVKSAGIKIMCLAFQ